MHAGESSRYRTHLPIILAFAPDRKKDFQMHWTALKSTGYRGNEGVWMESFGHPHAIAAESAGLIPLPNTTLVDESMVSLDEVWPTQTSCMRC